MCIACSHIHSSPSCFWWEAGIPVQKKRWYCSRACILKSKLDRHHEIRLKIKFHLYLRDFCSKKNSKYCHMRCEIAIVQCRFCVILYEELNLWCVAFKAWVAGHNCYSRRACGCKIYSAVFCNLLVIKITNRSV